MAVIEFFEKIFSYIGAINVNGGVTFAYWLSNNFMAILSFILFVVLAAIEISIKDNKYIHDERSMY